MKNKLSFIFLSILIYSGIDIASNVFASDYVPPKNAVTPIISTRGHMEDYLLDDPKLVSGHTKIDYDTSTNVPVIDTVGRPTEIVIYVHGFQNDEQLAVENFNAVKEAFRKNNYDIPVVGFSWDSDVGILNFNDAKIIANMNGPKLAKAIIDIKDESPSTKIKLIGHSLGSRVILQTLQTLHDGEKYRRIRVVQAWQLIVMWLD